MSEIETALNDSFKDDKREERYTILTGMNEMLEKLRNHFELTRTIERKITKSAEDRFFDFSELERQKKSILTILKAENSFLSRHSNQTSFTSPMSPDPNQTLAEKEKKNFGGKQSLVKTDSSYKNKTKEILWNISKQRDQVKASLLVANVRQISISKPTGLPSNRSNTPARKNYVKDRPNAAAEELVPQEIVSRYDSNKLTDRQSSPLRDLTITELKHELISDVSYSNKNYYNYPHLYTSYANRVESSEGNMTGRGSKMDEGRSSKQERLESTSKNTVFRKKTDHNSWRSKRF